MCEWFSISMMFLFGCFWFLTKKNEEKTQKQMEKKIEKSQESFEFEAMGRFLKRVVW